MRFPWLRSCLTFALVFFASAASAAPDEPKFVPVLEPKAVEILKAASSRLAAARTLSFTAVVYYENPSLVGPPLVYATKSDVIAQRPDKLRVLTSADGPPSEFFYDGKVMIAYAPQEGLAAVADAPPTIDAALKVAYDAAAIYYPFEDLIVADPYKDIAATVEFAFYIGQSKVVGGTTTDMVAYGDADVFLQIWIGADDKLPRMLRAIYRKDPARLRHALEISDWKLDLAIPAGTFASARSGAAKKIPFARPDKPLPATPKAGEPAP